MKMNNLKLVCSTRATSHLKANCSLLIRKALIGKDFGLANQVAYTAQNYEQLYVVRVVYEDGYFGDNLVGIKNYNNCIFIHHISHTPGHTWTMKFDKI